MANELPSTSTATVGTAASSHGRDNTRANPPSTLRVVLLRPSVLFPAIICSLSSGAVSGLDGFSPENRWIGRHLHPRSTIPLSADSSAKSSAHRHSRIPAYQHRAALKPGGFGQSLCFRRRVCSSAIPMNGVPSHPPGVDQHRVDPPKPAPESVAHGIGRGHRLPFCAEPCLHAVDIAARSRYGKSMESGRDTDMVSKIEGSGFRGAAPRGPHKTRPAWHALASSDLLRHFGVDPATGLSDSAVLAARKEHGSNSLPEPRAPGPVARLLHSFRSPLVLLLTVAAGIALALGHRTDAIAIVGVMVVNAVIGAWHESRADRSMAALRHWAEIAVRVVRADLEVRIPARDLVPGDIVLLEAGDAVAADIRLVQTSHLQASEAALTGESVPVPKSLGPVPSETPASNRACMVFSGTFVTAGRGIGVVVGTGVDTEFGTIALLTQS
ncbi:MAG: cation-transporting P-type ATPase, partial [Armatimonadaceae bacterium]